MDGILLIDKPIGWTSFDVVAKVRGTLRSHQLKDQNTDNRILINNSPKVKVGHTGTLDPQATGLLVMVIGSYCKRAQEFSKLDKTYEVTMKLGYTSSTGDGEGIITKNPDKQNPRRPSEKLLIEEVLRRFEGEIMQVPPAHSAIKINGQRAYKLARAGKEVKLEPRQVTINKIELTDYSYPDVNFNAEVSSGTYIRSLVEDIGRVLGTGAYMSALRRTNVGRFDVNNALTIDDITAEAIFQNLINA